MSGMKINQRQMQQAMRKMGITNETVPGVIEVIIRTADKEIVVSPARVTAVSMQGQKSFQVDGEVSERPLGAVSEPVQAPAYSAEDVELVMAQAGCDKAKAEEALEACGGDLAEAILKIMGA